METQNQSEIDPLHLAMQKRYLKRIGLTTLPEWNGKPDERVDGNMLCSVCGYAYSDHPSDFSVVYEGRPVFKLDCTGQRLKL